MASSKSKSNSVLPRRRRRKRPEALQNALTSDPKSQNAGVAVAAPQGGVSTIASGPDGSRGNNSGKDVVGILVRSVLGVADDRGEIRDGAVLSAFRAVSRRREPNSEPAARIYSEIRSRLDQSRVDGDQAARAAEELVELVAPYSDPKDQQCILRFLSLLVE